MKCWVHVAINDNYQDICLTILPKISPFGIDRNIWENWLSPKMMSYIKKTNKSNYTNFPSKYNNFIHVLMDHYIPYHSFTLIHKCISVLPLTYTIHTSIQFSFYIMLPLWHQWKRCQSCIIKTCCLLLINSSFWICNLQNQSSVYQSIYSIFFLLYLIY